MKNSFFLLYLIFLLSPLTAAYTKSPHVSLQEWEEVAPYLLSENHPAKTILDSIFANRRAVLSIKAMKRAGFLSPEPQRTTRIIVTRHPRLPGYIIKTYLDSQRARKNMVESTFWRMRINGAKAIQELLDKDRLNHLFKVPKKWIYPLPAEPSPPKVFQRINFILVEEDMKLVPQQQNLAIWKSDQVNFEYLKSLVHILETLGLHDCAKPDNIPFSIDGRIAFVDTQTHGRWPVNYKRLSDHLSPAMKRHWKELVKELLKK